MENYYKEMGEKVNQIINKLDKNVFDKNLFDGLVNLLSFAVLSYVIKVIFMNIFNNKMIDFYKIGEDFNDHEKFFAKKMIKLLEEKKPTQDLSSFDEIIKEYAEKTHIDKGAIKLELANFMDKSLQFATKSEEVNGFFDKYDDMINEDTNSTMIRLLDFVEVAMSTNQNIEDIMLKMKAKTPHDA